MARSYDEILETMRNAYYQQAGVLPQRCGDTDIKLRLLAGELYSLCTNIEWLKKQMFPTTASGSQLDLHAEQRGLTRLPGSKATGLIIFSLNMPLDHDLLIPQGTVCTTADGSVNFITSQNGTISAGTTSTYISSEAQFSGKQYNVAPGAVKSVVTSFSVGLSVQNSTPFSSGTDDESDDELRARIISHMKNISNGINKQYYIDLARSLDGVYSAQVTENTNTHAVTVYVADRGGRTTDAVLAQAAALINSNRPLGLNIQVSHPQVMNCEVTVSIKPADNYTFTQAQNNVTEAIEDMFDDLEVGQGITLARLGSVIIGAEGVANYSFGSSMADKPANDGFLWYKGTVTITEMT